MTPTVQLPIPMNQANHSRNHEIIGIDFPDLHDANNLSLKTIPGSQLFFQPAPLALRGINE